MKKSLIAILLAAGMAATTNAYARTIGNVNTDKVGKKPAVEKKAETLSKEDERQYSSLILEGKEKIGYDTWSKEGCMNVIATIDAVDPLTDIHEKEDDYVRSELFKKFKEMGGTEKELNKYVRSLEMAVQESVKPKASRESRGKISALFEEVRSKEAVLSSYIATAKTKVPATRAQVDELGKSMIRSYSELEKDADALAKKAGMKKEDLLESLMDGHDKNIGEYRKKGQYKNVGPKMQISPEAVEKVLKERNSEYSGHASVTLNSKTSKKLFELLGKETPKGITNLQLKSRASNYDSQKKMMDTMYHSLESGLTDIYISRELKDGSTSKPIKLGLEEAKELIEDIKMSAEVGNKWVVGDYKGSKAIISYTELVNHYVLTDIKKQNLQKMSGRGYEGITKTAQETDKIAIFERPKQK